MPGFVVNATSQVVCAHQGKVILQSGVAPRVLVMGAPAVMALPPYPVAGCTFPPPIAANGPCLTAKFTTCSTRVFVNLTQPLLLQDSLGMCAPTGTPTVVQVTQQRVFAT